MEGGDFGETDVGCTTRISGWIPLDVFSHEGHFPHALSVGDAQSSRPAKDTASLRRVALSSPTKRYAFGMRPCSSADKRIFLDICVDFHHRAIIISN